VKKEKKATQRNQRNEINKAKTIGVGGRVRGWEGERERPGDLT